MSVSRRRYRPLLELGRGGMAKVYLAESLASGIRKLVVLKVLNRDLADEKEMRAAFRREAELSARMNHPNVVQVFEVVEYGGIPVIVMEYLDGVALSRILQHVQLPLRLHLYALTQVLDGLHHFHELKDFEGNEFNAVHRDVSPQNVLVLHEGPVKVVDFGIAKINTTPDHQTRTGMIKGKIHYMPPEQLMGETSIDRRADVFAVGVMLWEAIAGHRMWEGLSEGKVIRALAKGDLPKLRDVAPNVSEDLERICDKALKIERAERFSTAQEMQIELEQALVKMEGYVQPRELTDFMLKNFGDRRQFQQRTVERALRSPASTVSGVMECVTPPSVEVERPSGPIGLEDDILNDHLPGAPGLSRSSVVSVQKSRSWSSALLIAGAFSALLVGGIWFFSRQAPTPTPPPVSAVSTPTPPVELQIVAHPPNAEIFVDGAAIGSGSVQRQYPASRNTASIEVRLAGYVTQRRTVRLSGDTSLEVILSPEATPAEPATAKAKDAASEKARAAVASRPRYAAPRGAAKAAPAKGAPAAAPDAAPAPASAPTAQVNCNPPYKLSADGVKMFKPECF